VSGFHVAIASGEVMYDGRLEEITAGVTYIADGHEIVRRNPHMFKKAPTGSMKFPGGGSSGHSRARSIAPKAHAREEIDLRSSESPISVVLDEAARRTIVDEVADWASFTDGESRESGGFLFGRRSDVQSGDWHAKATPCVELTFAAYAGENTKRERGSVVLDIDKAHSVERALRRTREHLVGDYHSHPEGDGEPSPGDLRAWMRSIQMLMGDDPPPTWLLGDEVKRDCWAGIIVTSSSGGSWMYPQLHAWVTRWDYAGFICEPATLIEED
jgi:proteasome lid subunit RPN8/RPN11